MTTVDQIKEIYLGEYRIAIDKIVGLDKKINRVSMLRLLLIVLGLALLFNTVQTGSVLLTISVTLGVLLLFTYLVYVQSKLEKSRKDWINYRIVRENELAVMDGKENMYPHGADYERDKHAYALDLDIFGPKSLYAYINRCASPEGRGILAQWLGEGGQIDDVRQRQELVQELSTDVSWYQEIQAELLFQFKDSQSYGELVWKNLSMTVYDFGTKALRVYVSCVPYIMLASIVMAFFFGVFVRVTIWMAVIHLLVAMGYAGRVSKMSQGLSKISDGLRHFSHVFSMIENRDWQSVLGKRLRANFAPGDLSVSAAIKNLSKLLEKLDYRMNILVATFLNAFFLWDLRQAFALLDWREVQGDNIRDAFNTFGQYEALVSFAALHVNHPSWVFPQLHDTKEKLLQVEGLKHPLIREEKAVANDYHMEGHQLALVTGSNMAGKSTFLRTIGVNMVLAMTGGPVCAERMVLSSLRPISYMRIKDNLNESTSTFKAELDRLQMILEEVEKRDDVYFLIDEMLRGTNSVDKYLGSKAVIERLIKMEGVGMVATHDLQLADLATAYPAYLRNYHFDIQVQQGEMLFDYKLKNGPCHIFNASMLLKRIGIDIENV